MSLGGIAIAIGAMVDAAIIMIENAHKHLERERGQEAALADHRRRGQGSRADALLRAARHHRVVRPGVHARGAGRPALQAAGVHQDLLDGRGLAAVGHARAGADGLLDPRTHPAGSANPVSRLLIRIYDPVLHFVLRCKCVLALAVVALGLTWIPYRALGSEFMPPLWEGDLLYMPTMLPGVSISKAREVLQQTDKIIRSFPEVERVFGKAGRADTATDPAPLSMFETTITLKPESRVAGRA